MQPLLIGIDGLSYSRFMDCDTRTLFNLIDYAERGVTRSSKPLKPCSSWRYVLGLNDSQEIYESQLIKAVSPALINLPLKNPTLGYCSVDLNSSGGLIEEINCVEKRIKDNVTSRPVIACITALERAPLSRTCELYRYIDEFVKSIMNFVENYILFSSYGILEKGCKEKFGVYLASIKRPRARDMVDPSEIGSLFLRMLTSSDP